MKLYLLLIIIPISLLANISVQNRNILEMKNKDTILTIGGRIDLKAIESSYGARHRAKEIVLNDSGKKNIELVTHAKDSRFWLKTRTPSKYGTIRTLIETDFYGNSGNEVTSNSHGLRLRHAYMQIGNFVIGQTSSAFNTHITLDIIHKPINDTTLVRQPLIKYRQVEDSYKYCISFEQPETTLIDSNSTVIIPKDDILPDVVTKIAFYPTWGEFGISLMGRYLRQNKETSSDYALGWGVNISGKIKLFGFDDIRFGGTYGNGVGRYLALNSFTAGFIGDDSKITLKKSYGAHLGYRHLWNQKLRSTISFSYAKTDNTDQKVSDLDALNKDVYSFQQNLLYAPIKNSLVGIEYAHAKRTVQSAKSGVLDSVMMLYRYDF